MAVTQNEVLKELKRELHSRQRAYPRWVEERQYGYTQELADYRLACLRKAILDLADVYTVSAQ